MTTNGTKEKIRSFLSKYIKKKDLKEEDELFTSRLVNSMFAMQLVLFIEKEFSFKVENEDLDLKNFNSINAISAFVERKAAP
ncbi:acyl carrier protein [Desulfobacterales bacterium HSG2]|nr:acyl carrier protein [Desulfobacterales bacterium HSG2]